MEENIRDIAVPLDQAGRVLPLLHAAISRLGYSPREMIWDAALRMARVNDLSLDLIAFANTGQPAMDYAAGTPVVLFRPLPYDYTIARLIRDFDLKPVGSFLLATDLIYDPEKTLALLNDFARHGYWTFTDDGRHVLHFPPVSTTTARIQQDDLETDFIQAGAASLPADTCQTCHNPVRPGMKFCEHCGAAVRNRPPVDIPPSFCPACGTPVIPGRKFCGSCGSPVNATVPQSPATCPNCGSPIKSGITFCGDCGLKIP